MKRIFTFAIIGILCISMFVMLIPKARGQETAVSFSFQGNFSGSITNGVFSITSGTVSVGSNMYSVINTPPSDYPSSQSFNQFLTATSGDLDAGCISLTNNYVMGLAALYTQTDSASLSVSFGGGSGFSGTTAITIGFDGPLLTCIIASGNLQVSGSTFTLSASTSGTEPVQSSTSVSVSPNPVYAASPVTCTATVSVSNPTGTITWSTSSSTGTFSSTQTTLTSGTSTTTYTDTSPGTVSITATYSGDSVNSPSSGETGLTISLTPKTQPIEILDYVPITITNAQNSPMPAPFQQIVHVNSAAYSQLEAPNLQNIEFFDSSGNIIPSWFESGNSNSATDTIYWLLLANGIPAHSSVTVYMGFASQTVNLLNPQTTGEAPQLSPIYGQYDDGAHVFNFYDNFAGSSLSNKWNANLGTGSYQVNNGLTINFGGGYLVSSTTFGPGTKCC